MDQRFRTRQVIANDGIAGSDDAGDAPGGGDTATAER